MGAEIYFGKMFVENIESEYFEMHRDDLNGALAVIDTTVCVGECCSSSTSSKG